MTLKQRLAGRLQRSARSLLYQLGAESILYKGKSHKDLVLLFHNVLEDARQDLNLRNIGKRDFSKLLRYLKKHYSIVSVEEILKEHSGGPRIAITFDDGLINNLRYALPVIDELQVPATFFITSSWIRGESVIWPDELSHLLAHHEGNVTFGSRQFQRVFRNQFRSVNDHVRLEDVLINSRQQDVTDFMEALRKNSKLKILNEADEAAWRIMKGEEIKILSQSPLVEIGSHAVTHNNMNFMNEDELRTEFLESKKYLEQVCGCQIKSFAFPFGQYSDKAIVLGHECGYERLIGVYPLSGSVRLPDIVNRMGIYNDITLTETLHQINSFLR